MTPRTNQRFKVQWGDKQFAYTLAGFAGATFTWMGTQVGNDAFDPSSQIQASSFNSILGLQTEPTSDTLGGYDVGYAANGDYLLFKNVNFPAGVYAVTARVASAGSGGSLDFRLDTPSGKVIGTATIPVTGGWQTWTNVSGAVSGVVGLHNLYVVFRGTTSIGNVNWFRFSVNQPPALAPIASRTILAGRTLTITNSATDPESPPETLTFSLPLGPAGASINSNSGVFSWRPAIAQSPSTQTVTVAVFDNGTPAMSATQSFTVTVERPVAPAIGLAGITNGQFGFWINGDTGPDYLIQSSTNLQSWSTVSMTNSPALPYLWIDTNSSSFPVRFFRTVLGP